MEDEGDIGLLMQTRILSSVCSVGVSCACGGERASADARRTREGGLATNLFVDGVRSSLATSSALFEERIATIASLLADLDAERLKPKSIAARQRDILVGQIAKIRPLLKAYLALDLRNREADRWPALIRAWRQTFALKLSGMSEEMCPPKSPGRATLSVDRNPLKARQAAEAPILWEIRQALRRGSVYVPHSLSYREKQVLFDTRVSGSALYRAAKGPRRQGTPMVCYFARCIYATR